MEELEKLDALYLAGLDQNLLPGVERLEIEKVVLMKATDTSSARKIIILKDEPLLIPLNGSSKLSWNFSDRKLPNNRKYNRYKMLTKQSLATGRRKASFHKTREGALDRLHQWIETRRKHAEKEYAYVTKYMAQLNVVQCEDKDFREEHQNQIIEEMKPKYRRKMFIESEATP